MSATLEPDETSLGHVITKDLPLPTQAMCKPGSPWIDVKAKEWLAGDRAVRVARPAHETAGGGPDSDYAVANDYLDAVYPSTEVEDQLDRLCFELDAFFRVPQVRQDVLAVTKLLLSERTVSGGDLRRLVNGGNHCGAYWPDFQRRCIVDPHSFYASHISHDRPSPPVFWSPLGWIEDRTPFARRSSSWKRVARLHSPELLPPRPRKITYADLPQLKADAKDARLSHRQREAASRKVVSLIATRIREAAVAHSLPRPEDGSDDGVVELLDRHREEFGSELERTDLDYWCERCGLEIGTSGGRNRWVYLTVEYRRVREIDADGTEGEAEWMATPGLSFPTADQARNYLRLARATEAGPLMGVRRIARR